MGADMKRFKKSVQKIGTHSGVFHCDEVLAVVMLKMLPECAGAEVIRTRDESILKDCDVVVDVGAVFDPSCHRYDHHQRSFSDTMSSLSGGAKPWTTKLSSAGLVYHHFGRDVIAARLDDGAMDAEKLEAVYDRLYETFVEEVDAVDNGISQTDGTPRYKVTSTLGARVSRLNPAWNEPDQSADARFDLALTVVEREFLESLQRAHRVWLPARQFVAQAIADRHQVDDSGYIMELKTGGLPWKDHLFALEKQQQTPCEVLFVVFTDQGGMYRVQAVPPHASSFDLRVPLPEAWRGLRNDELAKESGLPGAMFVHATGFIGGVTTRDEALQMARHALKEAGRI